MKNWFDRAMRIESKASIPIKVFSQSFDDWQGNGDWWFSLDESERNKYIDIIRRIKRDKMEGIEDEKTIKGREYMEGNRTLSQGIKYYLTEYEQLVDAMGHQKEDVGFIGNSATDILYANPGHANIYIVVYPDTEEEAFDLQYNIERVAKEAGWVVTITRSGTWRGGNGEKYRVMQLGIRDKNRL